MLALCWMRFNLNFVKIILQEKISKLKTSESKLEEDKKNLRVGLDDAESRCTKLELARRALDGELQRLKLAMTDKETENQVNCSFLFGKNV